MRFTITRPPKNMYMGANNSELVIWSIHAVEPRPVPEMLLPENNCSYRKVFMMHFVCA